MAIVTDGLVLYLHGACGKNNPATRVWKDLSGNGNDGELVNFGYIEDSGWVDGGLRFDGVDDYVNCGKINFGTEDFTIEMIAKINNIPNIYGGTIIGNRGGLWEQADTDGVGTELSFPQNRQYINFRIADGENIKTQYAIFDFTDNKQHHIIAQKTSKEMKIYIDGVLIGTVNHTVIGEINGRYRMKIGSRGNCIFLSDTNIYLTRIYNRALTDEEILQNYQAGHEWTPQIGKREVTTTMKPITSSLSRKGTGRREFITTVKPITTSLERKGKGKREVITTMKPITSSLSRKGVGRREVITTMQPITSSISKKLPPIHANMDIRERIPKLEVD